MLSDWVDATFMTRMNGQDRELLTDLGDVRLEVEALGQRDAMISDDLGEEPDQGLD